MTEKNKKKKETTPACNGTQLQATRHSTHLSFVQFRSANAQFKKNSEGATVGQTEHRLFANQRHTEERPRRPPSTVRKFKST
jgi:hypothetical protein